jgi:TPR repeat protein
VVVASLEVGPDASVDELYRAGLAYSTGRGVGIDLIRAHQYFNLAASRGSEIAKACRKELADAMTPTEVKTAQRAAREWLSRAN